MNPIHLEGVPVEASLDDRTITVALIPYGEEGRTNVGRFRVNAGAIAIPADPSVATLNLDHDHFQPVGRASRIWETAKGIFASFAFANTPEGDAALADATDPNGRRRRVSAEFTTGIRNGIATGGRLVGAALVERGAFPSAMVLAADTPDDEDADGDVIAENHADDTYTDSDGRVWKRVYDSETVETDTGTQTTTTITETTTNPDAADQAADPTEEETNVSATAVPPTHRTGAPTAPATTEARPTDLRKVFAAFAEVKGDLTRSLTDADHAVQVLAALSDIKTTGAGALPTGGNVIQPNWVGQLYQGIPYERQYITLGTLGTDITLGGKKGYKLARGTSAAPVTNFDGEWAGDKAAIKSGVGFTTAASSTLHKWAFGNDIAREFFDLEGGAELIEAFIKLILEDHLVWSDEKARLAWVTAAGAPIAPSVYPGVDGHDYATAIGQLIQGILAVKAPKADKRRDMPTFAIANELAYEQLIYTPKDLLPEFVTFGANTDREGTADGLRVVVGDTGIEDTPSVIVGSGKAIEFDELAGGPLRIDALDLARGGIDKAVHGYLQEFIVRPEAVVHIGTADAAA